MPCDPAPQAGNAPAGRAHNGGQSGKQDGRRPPGSRPHTVHPPGGPRQRPGHQRAGATPALQWPPAIFPAGIPASTPGNARPATGPPATALRLLRITNPQGEPPCPRHRTRRQATRQRPLATPLGNGPSGNSSPATVPGPPRPQGAAAAPGRPSILPCPPHPPAECPGHGRPLRQEHPAAEKTPRPKHSRPRKAPPGITPRAGAAAPARRCFRLMKRPRPCTAHAHAPHCPGTAPPMPGQHLFPSASGRQIPGQGQIARV